ncbi:MAG: dockerin type I domain-containing protein, partial [Planctomycetota bacterium]
AALLIDAGQSMGCSSDPRVIKSVLLNSADKLSGWTHTSTSPLDMNQGAGQMNLKDAYLQYAAGEQTAGIVEIIGWDTEQLTWDNEKLYAIDADVPAGSVMTMTLAWDRVVTTDTEDLKKVVYTFDHLDNLDLYLYALDDLTVPLASSVSTIDNVEHIHYAADDAGRYVIGVKMTGASPGDSEIYSLAWHVDPVTALAGDANLDSLVDTQDFTILKAHLGEAGSWNKGDFNDDGIIDTQDFSILKAHLGQAAAAGSAVPEPTAIMLLICGAPALLRRKRKTS